jgi:hypothetical protein
MILVITRLCYALYMSGDHVTDPLELTCLDFNAPVQYDVTECEGEVTTPADMSSESTMSATCETDLY